MKQSLESTIYLQCPIIFRKKNAGFQTGVMAFGFEHDDGWFEIIQDLSIHIEAIANKMKSSGTPEKELPAILQVKEKFGCLRIYMAHATTEIQNLVNEACNKSEVTCEVCGKPGEPRHNIHVQTLCDEHDPDNGLHKVSNIELDSD